MHLNLYNCTCEKHRVDKSGYFADEIDLEGTLKESTNVLNPTIMVEMTANTFPAVNYAYIQEFNRYYFITNITSVTPYIWAISMRVDVLMSFRGHKNGTSSTGIYKLNCFVDRNENTTDTSISDTFYPVKNVPTIIDCPCTEGSSNWVSSESFYKTQATARYNYMIATNAAFSVDSDSLVRSEQIAPYDLCSFTYSGLTNFMNSLKNAVTITDLNNNISDYIVGAYAFPFAIPYNTVTNRNVAAMFRPSSFYGTAHKLLTFQEYGRIPNEINIKHVWQYTLNFTAGTAEYLKYPPYSTITVEFMPFGRFAIDLRALGVWTTFIYFVTKTNILTGESALYYGSSEYDADLHLLSTANACQNVPIASREASAKNLLSSVVQSTGNIAAGMITGDVMGMASSALNIAAATQRADETFRAGNSVIIDSLPKVTIRQQFPITGAPSLYGKLLAQNKYLYQLTGYTKVGEVHVENLTISALDAELTEIENLLKTGVIL